MNILVVDDEPTLVKGIKFNLVSEGYSVDTASNGVDAVAAAKLKEYDLIILDVMMPDMDGIEACMKIREFSTAPIIMLTARSESSDKLLGFESGADDYLTKPFDIIELKARIRALIRRSAMTKQGGSASIIKCGNVQLDTLRRVAIKNGTMIDLTAREFDVLELLAKNPGRVYSREQLLNIVWESKYQGELRTVDVHVRRLREKLEDEPANPKLICTKWGVGYFLKG